jgi:hypothetical protein
MAWIVALVRPLEYSREIATKQECEHPRVTTVVGTLLFVRVSCEIAYVS